MKKLLTVIAIMTLIVSCSKKYTCTCDAKVYTNTDTISTKRISTFKTTKKEMKKVCKDETWGSGYTSSNGQVEKTELTNCSIQ